MKNELRHSNRTRDDSDWRELAAQTRAQRRAKGMSEPQIDVGKVAAEWAEGYGGVDMSNKNLMNNAWALIIGINNYEQDIIYGPLECCVPDAIGLYILLTHPDGSGVNPDQVCLLVDGADDYIKRIAEDILQQMQARRWLSGVVRRGIVDKIVNRQQEPTREHILHEMNRWAHTAGSDNWLLVHYSGHGDVFDGDIYLIPPRAHFSSLSDTAIPLSRMKELMQGSRAWAKVLSLDTCYSGSVVGRGVPHSTTEESQKMVLAAADKMAVLTSCLPYERALESGSLFSVFGKYLLEGLSGAADEKNQKFVTLLDLHHYVELRVKRWVANIPDAPTQTPFLHAPGVLSHLALTGSEAAAHNAVLKGTTEIDRERWPHGKKALPKSPPSVGTEVLADSFALGYSLIGAVASAGTANLQGQRSICLRGVLQSSGNLGINVPAILSEAIPIEEFLTGETIPSLRYEISHRYGEKASSAFEMGIWLAVSPLSEHAGRQRALIHVEALAQTVGLDPVYVSKSLHKVRTISDRFEFADEITQFILETVKQLQSL